MPNPDRLGFVHGSPFGAGAFAVCLVLWVGFTLPNRTHGAESAPAASTAGQSPNLTKAARFWSFQQVQPVTPPAVRDSKWVATPIDRFILAGLERSQLKPAPPATRLELIRRLSFDLTGLAPTVEEVRAFCADPAPDAYERLADRLLASPRFGERSAQFWLDVVRFAETEGFEYDRHLPDAWRYRDYVIDSLNTDKPYDQFITEQIAGDELSPSNVTALTAAIFHRLGPVRRNAGNPEIALSRNEVLTERTDILGAAFLGLTMGCARCHDHKLDPISQQDYYRLQAYVAATQEHDVVLLDAAAKQRWEVLNGAHQAQLKQLRMAADAAEGAERVRLRAQIESLEARQPVQPPIVPSIHNDASQRTPIHVLKRGDWKRKGEAVGMRPPTVLVGTDRPELPVDHARPRTELAAWLTDPAHPLTARVAANRLWQRHFGAGIVRTANDFGSHGDRPSHPELLDWLASQLIRHGWQTKPLQRMMVLSSAYRQSSVSLSEPEARRLDPENRLLWRFQRRRLSAEEIRDAMLAASRLLDLRAGGPGIMTPVDPELVQLLYKPAQWAVAKDRQEHHRRSIYLIVKRNLQLPFMETFDQPNRLASSASRQSSTHAPQALELLNGALANELAKAFASRLKRETAGGAAPLIERASELALGRPPTAGELSLALAFLAAAPVEEYALALFNVNAFLYAP